MSYNKSISSVNNYIENKIKSGKIIKNNTIYNNYNNNVNDNIDNELNELDILSEEIEIEKLENELNTKMRELKNHPKNYGNLWTDEERKIILKYLKKNSFSIETGATNLYDETVIQKIAEKTERSEYGVKEEIKKMIFNDYIGEFDTYTKLSIKYNIPENNIKILIKLYLEKYGKKILYPIEIENKILKYQVENIKLKAELRELIKKQI
jgi:hypothetical protein